MPTNSLGLRCRARGYRPFVGDFLSLYSRVFDGVPVSKARWEGQI